jgi:Arm domain-containing DNA-binding protein
MPLTDVSVRQARAKEKEYRLSDERGLLLMVRPTGAKWWRLRYRFQGRHQMISPGVDPDVLLIYGTRPAGRSHAQMSSNRRALDGLRGTSNQIAHLGRGACRRPSAFAGQDDETPAHGVVANVTPERLASVP